MSYQIICHCGRTFESKYPHTRACPLPEYQAAYQARLQRRKRDRLAKPPSHDCRGGCGKKVYRAWCDSPDCQDKKKERIKQASLAWHKKCPEPYRPTVVVIDPSNPQDGKLCQRCKKVPRWPNRFYCRDCHSILSRGCAEGYEGFSPATETYSLFSSNFPGHRRRAAT